MNCRVTPMNCQRQKSFVQREGRWLLFWEFQQKATRLENLTFHDLQNCQKNPEGGGHVFLHVLFTQQSHVEGVFSFVLPDGQTCFFLPVLSMFHMEILLVPVDTLDLLPTQHAIVANEGLFRDPQT